MPPTTTAFVPAHSATPFLPEASARSGLYRFLSLAFRYPSPEMFEGWRDGSLAAELSEWIAGLPHLSGHARESLALLAQVPAELDGMAYREFEAHFVRTFDAAVPAPPCPPYERFYRADTQVNVLLQVSELYRHFGLQMGREEGRRDLPDHLCAELEMMHFLAFKEAQAETEGTADLLHGYRLAQRDFLARHLTQWVPRFAEKLRERSALPCYGYLASLTAELLAEDLRWVDEAIPAGEGC